MNIKNLILAGIALLSTGCSQAGTKDASDLDTYQTPSGKTVRIIPVKHASIRIQYDGLEFQIDPVGKRLNPETDYSQGPKADYILVTHEHSDHFDPDAIRLLTKDATRLVLNENCRKLFGGGTAMGNGDSLRLAPGIMLYAVPAYNTTPGHTQYHPKGRDNGFILSLDGLRIYIAGDTEDIPEMAEIKDIDIAFMPCNQPFTMTPTQLRKAAEMVKPKVLYPYHFSETPVGEMEKALEGLGIDIRMRPFK